MQTSGRAASVPLAFQPGEAFQFDRSEDLAVIGGHQRVGNDQHVRFNPAARQPDQEATLTRLTSG
jgi:hypothetical protein